MSDAKDKMGAVLRFLASDGMADEDPEVVRELLTRAHDLAAAVVSDPGASPATRADAKAFLDELSSDTYGRFGSEPPQTA